MNLPKNEQAIIPVWKKYETIRICSREHKTIEQTHPLSSRRKKGLKKGNAKRRTLYLLAQTPFVVLDYPQIASHACPVSLFVTMIFRKPRSESFQYSVYWQDIADAIIRCDIIATDRNSRWRSAGSASA